MAQGAIFCRYHDAGECGSCPWFEESYPQQLARKNAAARQALAGVIPGDAWLAPVGSPATGFRNKAKMVVTGTWDNPQLGLASGVDLSDCPLYLPAIRAAFPALKQFIRATMLQPYDLSPAAGRITAAKARGRGELKNVIVTASPAGQLMVSLVMRSTADLARINSRLPELLANLPNLRVFSVNIHPEHKATLIGEREIVLTPQAVLPMAVGPIELQLGPQSFFQTNTGIAAQLYGAAASWIAELGSAIGRIWDLYCGVGGFALALATLGRDAAGRDAAGRDVIGRSVTGVELSAEAIANANAACQQLGLSSQVEFIAQDATEFAITTPTAKPDLVVVNPPRRGIGPTLRNWLNPSGVPYLLYSSCNPATLAIDLAALPNYTVRRAQLFDMFPNTAHSEVLTLLEQNQADSGRH